MSTLLEVQDLSVSYGKVEAVHRVSVGVGEGRIVTVIGPNGAGKTTLLAAIMGLLPARGRMLYRGGPLAALTVEQRVAAGLVLVPEKRELFATMTVADNLELGAFAARRQQSHDRREQRRLAGAVGADDRDDAAFGDRQRNAVHRLDLAVGDVQVDDLQQYAHGRRSIKPPPGKPRAPPGCAGYRPAVLRRAFRRNPSPPAGRSVP